jgi:hypothetical protein
LFQHDEDYGDHLFDDVDEHGNFVNPLDVVYEVLVRLNGGGARGISLDQVLGTSMLPEEVTREALRCWVVLGVVKGAL